MRLIDADAYAAEMRIKREECRAWKDSLQEGTELHARAEQSLVTFIEAALTLKSQPTINAIPIGWLKQKRDSQSDPWDYLANAIDYILAVYKKEQEAR